LRKRKNPVDYTRSRPYKKNDNAHIEQKNLTIVRQYMGYDRIETHKTVKKMNRLYRNDFSMFLNYFIPSVKQISKVRIASKLIKKYDEAKTPYQRIQESKFIKKEKNQTLKEINSNSTFFKSINKIIQIYSIKNRKDKLL
jgi:hypothetical protein